MASFHNKKFICVTVHITVKWRDKGGEGVIKIKWSFTDAGTELLLYLWEPAPRNHWELMSQSLCLSRIAWSLLFLVSVLLPVSAPPNLLIWHINISDNYHDHNQSPWMLTQIFEINCEWNWLLASQELASYPAVARSTRVM